MTEHDAAPDGARQPILCTIFENHAGPLTKRAELDAAGRLRMSSDAHLSRGLFRTVTLTTIGEIAAIIPGLHPNEALCWGVARDEQRHGAVATSRAIAAGEAGGAIARTKESFVWHTGPGVLMIDVDLKDAPDHLTKSLEPLTLEQLREALIAAAPALTRMPMVGLPSASACLYRVDPHERLRGLTGARFYVPVARAANIPVLGTRLHERLILTGQGYPFISKAGLVQVRSLIDAAVWSPERLDFIGGAHCGPGLVQDRGAALCWNTGGSELLSDTDLPSLSPHEQAELERVRRMICAEAEAEAQAARARWAEERLAAGHRVSVRWALDGASLPVGFSRSDAPVLTLNGDHEICLADGTRVTVDEILANPPGYHQRSCADPLEPDYAGDSRIARIYTLGQDTAPTIHSFAHGGLTYLLRPSAAAEFSATDAVQPTTTGALPALPPSKPNNNLTDAGNGSRFARAFGNRLRYSSGRWLKWDGRRWASAERVDLDILAKQVPPALFAEASKEADDDRRKRIAKWAFDSESVARIRAMVSMAESELPASMSHFDADPFLLNVRNGTIDLRTGTLREHRPADGIAKLAPVDYDPDATCPRWHAFLDRVLAGDQELIRGVQRMVGYTLCGSTQEQVLFFLHGFGANGKSTFLETVRAALGEYASQSSFSTFLSRKHDSGPRNDIARLHGSRLVTAVEAGDGKKLDEAVVKSLTGGDTVTARFLYREEFEFRPQFKIWLAANHKPTIHGTDNGIWRRIRLVPFTVTIPDEEKDPGLPAALLAELPGILAWAVEGCLAWQRDGLGLPAAVRDATSEYRVEMDSFASFLRECCRLIPNGRTESQKLYDAYTDFCQGVGLASLHQRAFVARLDSHDDGRFKRVKSRGVKVWPGIELLPDLPVDTIEEIL